MCHRAMENTSEVKKMSSNVAGTHLQEIDESEQRNFFTLELCLRAILTGSHFTGLYLTFPMHGHFNLSLNG
jgi:hypothetical protein